MEYDVKIIMFQGDYRNGDIDKAIIEGITVRYDLGSLLKKFDDTYPYAKLAAVQLKFINDSIAHIVNEKERKRFVKATEKDLKEQFEKDLKKLTVTQGRILIKLVDRETGSTSYSLVKELRGSLQAFFWQGLARLFGSNLKSEYDGVGTDAQIEQIIEQIERGELKVQKIR